ncbi:MAG: phosphotransferase [Deltaproteobacteria bacterium]|jgi:Ser/Thr protein kinase RdoA (MazF antagonist)|nr:phosphotransferase [Deltaproteobacteria bacterium]
MTADLEEPGQILKKFYGLENPKAVPLTSGRVNLSFRAESGSRSFCLQKLNDFFELSPALGHNWQLAGEALKEASLPFPEIIPNISGRLLTESGGDLWRLTAWLEGSPFPAGDSRGAFLAGRTLGLCHRALNLPQPVRNLQSLPQGHNFTNQKLCRPEDFQDLFQIYRGHPHLGDLYDLIIRGSRAAAGLPQRPAFQRVFLARDQVIHGDPKRENFLAGGFSPALVDWDTAGCGDTLIDLGELCRSFASVKPAGAFRMELALEAVRGYEESGFGEPGRTALLLPAVIRGLAVCLIWRYLTDALAEVYFSWDKEHFESLFDQNRERAAALLTAAEELEERDFEFSRRLSDQSAAINPASGPEAAGPAAGLSAAGAAAGHSAAGRPGG